MSYGACHLCQTQQKMVMTNDFYLMRPAVPDITLWVNVQWTGECITINGSSFRRVAFLFLARGSPRTGVSDTGRKQQNKHMLDLSEEKFSSLGCHASTNSHMHIHTYKIRLKKSILLRNLIHL